MEEKVKKTTKNVEEVKNYFTILNDVNVNEHKEEKNGLFYLSWPWAWAEVKKRFPDTTFTIYENTLPNGFVVNYFTDGRTCWVKTGVTINGIEHIEELPVMDYRNKSIPLENVTSMNVNNSIQRSLTKAIGRHGLGLYIYAGEDLPEEDTQDMIKEIENKISLAKDTDTLNKIFRESIAKIDNKSDLYKRLVEMCSIKKQQLAA